MSLAVAIQMDPIAGINIAADSTFAMALEAQGRGHALYYYEPRHLAYRGGRTVAARAWPLTVRPVQGDHFTLGEPRVLDLAAVDVVLLRQDPPFNMAYITSTHLLDLVKDRTLVVNDPTEVRNAPEKLAVLQYPELMPPTVITAERDVIAAFREEHRDIVVKPLFGNGGAGVIHLRPGDENLGSLLEMYAALYPEPLMVQKYLPEIAQGDKRIILIDGEPAGAVNRVAAQGEARANFHAGGRAAKSGLTARDREICAAIGPGLRARGLVFVGIDVIGDYLTEINVTSPTGIHEINRLDDIRLEAGLWDAIEARHRRRGA